MHVRFDAVFCDRFWTKRDRMFGILLCPGDNGGQSLVLRVGKVSVRVEVQVFRDRERRASGDSGD
jgi:hypothetical protein